MSRKSGRRPILFLSVAFGLVMIIGSGLILYSLIRKEAVPKPPPPSPAPEIISSYTESSVVTVSEDFPTLFKQKLASIISNSDGTLLLLAFVGFTISLIVVLIMVRVSTSSGHLDLDPGRKPKPEYIYADGENKVAVITSIVILSIVVIATIASIAPYAGGMVYEMVAKKQTFKEDVIMYGDFSDSFSKRLNRRLTSGQSRKDLLKRLFYSNSHELAELLGDDDDGDGLSKQDYSALIGSYIDILGVECSNDPSHLTSLESVSVEKYLDEIPKVDVEHPSDDGTFEVAFTERPLDPLTTFTPRGINFCHTQVSDYHIFLDNRGKLVIVVRGDERPAFVIAMVALKYCNAGCSVSYSGKRIMKNIRSALDIFAPGTDDASVAFTIVQQRREVSEYMVDVMQAGVLAVAVKSKTSNQITAQTGFAPDNMKEVKYYRMTTKLGDIVLMYTNSVAYNVFPGVIAEHYRAASLAALVSALFAHATNAIHVPYPAENQPCSPVASNDGEQILTLNRTVTY